MTRAGLAIALAIACGGCDAMEWNFVTADAATDPPVTDATIDGDESMDAGTHVGVRDATATDARSPWPYCLRDGGCHNSDLHCSVEAGLCVPCFERSQCPDNVLNHCDLKPGDSYANLCVDCTENSDCNSMSGTSGSGGSSGSSAPSGSSQFCVAHQCVVSCTMNSVKNDCPMKGAPTCGPSSFCVLCTSQSDCPGNSPACSAIGNCVECADDSWCKMTSKPHCDLRTNQCVACTTSADCSSGFCDPSTSSCTPFGM